MKSKWIDHKGTQLFFADYANFETNEMAFQAEVDAVIHTVSREPESSVRFLADIRNTVGSQSNLDTIIRAAKRCKPNIIATAVIGVTGIRKVFMSSVMRASGLLITPVDSMDEAKEWLINQ